MSSASSLDYDPSHVSQRCWAWGGGQMSRPDWLDLQVRDLNLQSDFYQQLLGFEVLESSPNRVELGSRGKKLLGLQGGARRTADPEQAGLFHAAWLLPSRASLGSWLGATLARGMGIDGASDHGVSEAIYLRDPEGNGLEIYRDRPRQDWPVRSGSLAMTTDPLDLDSLLEASQGHSWDGFPEGAQLGHLHFQSPDLETVSRFFEELGFELTQSYGGARFLGLDGYHHDVAVNRWRARRPRDPEAAGLLAYGLRMDVAEVSQRLDPFAATCVLEPL